MAQKLVDMGMKRKELHPTEATSPATEKDYRNEKVYPEVRLSGAHAEAMGAEDLKKGDRVRQTVEWEVTEHSKHEENGKKPRYEMTLSLCGAGDQEECEPSDKKGNAEPDAIDDDEDESPAMAYIAGRAKDAG